MELGSEDLAALPVEENQSIDADEVDLSSADNSVLAMEEAVSIDADVKEIAEKASETAKMAVALALEVSEKTQDSVEKMQAAIEATFVATERAFEAAKKADFEIDTELLNTSMSSADVADKISKIQQKNISLKEINDKLAKKINQLRSSPR